MTAQNQDNRSSGSTPNATGTQTTGAENPISGSQTYASSGESDYWRDSFQNEPYYNSKYSFDDYSPAYQTGYESRGASSGESWDDVRGSLERDWQSQRGNSRMDWQDAEPAARAAYHRARSGDRNTARDSNTSDRTASGANSSTGRSST